MTTYQTLVFALGLILITLSAVELWTPERRAFFTTAPTARTGGG